MEVRSCAWVLGASGKSFDLEDYKCIMSVHADFDMDE